MEEREQNLDHPRQCIKDIYKSGIYLIEDKLIYDLSAPNNDEFISVLCSLVDRRLLDHSKIAAGHKLLILLKQINEAEDDARSEELYQVLYTLYLDFETTLSALLLKNNIRADN